VLAGVVDAVLPSGGHLGALVPLEVQVEPFAQAWATPQRRATVAAVKPDANPGPAARRLAEAGAQLIVLDCFGYHRGTLDAVRRASGLPVLSAVRCTAHLAAELAG
jgi:protein AroM